MAGARIVAQEDSSWRVEGEIDHHSVVALRATGERCLAGSDGRCRFDLSAVTRVNTAGLSLLLCWRRKADQLGVRLELDNVPAELYSIANISDLRTVLD